MYQLTKRANSYGRTDHTCRKASLLTSIYKFIEKTNYLPQEKETILVNCQIFLFICRSLAILYFRHYTNRYGVPVLWEKLHIPLYIYYTIFPIFFYFNILTMKI